MGESQTTGKPSSRASRFKYLAKLSRRSSRQSSTFSPSDILPQDGHKPYPRRPQSDGVPEHDVISEPELTLRESYDNRSISPPSVFDTEMPRDQDTNLTSIHDSDVEDSFDLKPPPPKVAHSNAELLASRFFSTDHLDLILRDPQHSARFTQFLHTYKPHQSSTLSHYVDSRKAIAAVEYANAIATAIPINPNEAPFIAATLDDEFLVSSRQAAEELVEDALPVYLTARLVSLVTESLVKDIIGTNVPAMKALVPNLAEVYCITDPSLKDNPIVYASEEFYKTTLYGSDYVIGCNCRFLQGPKTPSVVTRRLKEAITAGEEICETILNYRRDGSPFLCLLMVAPLCDDKGSARYFLGCQIDVTPLVDGGKGLDSFAQLLAQDHSDSQVDVRARHDSMDLLGELGQMLNEPEANFVRHRLRSESAGSGKSTPQAGKKQSARRVLSMDGTNYASPGVSGTLWPDAALGHSGRLPGVYRNYLLVRPYPSLRIIFTSPALRLPGLLQSKFTDRIGGPEEVREGLLQSLSSGTSVTAKISWLHTPASDSSESKDLPSGEDGKARWIHCTPLLGSDDKVGVWMVVLVEEEMVTGTLGREENTKVTRPATPLQLEDEDWRISGGNILYADYLKTGIIDDSPLHRSPVSPTSSMREKTDMDDQFRDFDR